MLIEKEMSATPIIILGILVLAIALSYWAVSRIKEGFFDINTDYTTLQKRLVTDLSPYCDLATYAQTQMKVIYTATGESESNAVSHIQQTYRDVYGCKDEDAASRPSCSLAANLGGRPDSKPGFISCDTYLTLPAWSSSDSGQAASIALSAIPDDLPDRITKEVEWYSQIITKLQRALDDGNNPPSMPPDSETSPANNKSGKPWSSSKDAFSDYLSWKVEGFVANTCSPEQAQARLQATQEADTPCTMPTPETQIARVNGILDSSTLQDSVAKCRALKAALVKLQSDQQKAKDGTLYAWQRDGSKKTYKKFPTGDRTTNFLSSMQQNQ